MTAYRGTNRHAATSQTPWTPALRSLAVAGIALGLGGCGTVLDTWTTNSGNLVAAEPLCEDQPNSAYSTDGTCQPAKPPAQSEIRKYISGVVKESEKKCDRFVTGLVLASNTTNTGLDLLTTLFNALGTAFTPLSTVHILTAAGSISSGSKTAIDADIYAKMTIANYAQVIKTGYYTGIEDYLDGLDKSDLTSADAGEEVAKIHSYHAQCSLASAQAALSATSAAPATPSTSPGTGNPPASTGSSPPAVSSSNDVTAANKAMPMTTPAPISNSSGILTRSTVPGHALR